MSILLLDSKVAPSWASTAQFISVSKLLAFLANSKTSYATLYRYDNMAYLSMRTVVGNTYFFKMRTNLWNLVNHVLSVRATLCDCGICRWRVRRQKYIDPEEIFRHVR